MYYLVNVDHNSRATDFTRSECEGFLRSAVNPMQWMRLMICYGMTVKTMVVVNVRQMKALTLKTETVTLFVKRT
jgi:hypothetical protein